MSSKPKRKSVAKPTSTNTRILLGSWNVIGDKLKAKLAAMVQAGAIDEANAYAEELMTKLEAKRAAAVAAAKARPPSERLREWIELADFGTLVAKTAERFGPGALAKAARQRRDDAWAIRRECLALPPLPDKSPDPLDDLELIHQWMLKALAEIEAGPAEAKVKAEQAAGDCTHNEDFTSVEWKGTRYTFAKGLQAQTIKALWEAGEKGGHGLALHTIREKVGSANERFRLAHVFRSQNTKPHPAYKAMIVEDGKGIYRLNW